MVAVRVVKWVDQKADHLDGRRVVHWVPRWVSHVVDHLVR